MPKNASLIYDVEQISKVILTQNNDCIAIASICSDSRPEVRNGKNQLVMICWHILILLTILFPGFVRGAVKAIVKRVVRRLQDMSGSMTHSRNGLFQFLREEFRAGMESAFYFIDSCLVMRLLSNVIQCPN